MKPWVVSAFLLLSFLDSAHLTAQENAQFPEAPPARAANFGSEIAAYHATPLSTTSSSAPGAAVERSSPPAYTAPRVADRNYFIINGVQAGMGIFDVEMTQHCISAHKCREANPFMPSSQAGQLSVNFAFTAYESLFSYWLKKRGSHIWWVTPVAGATAHAVGVGTGFAHY